MRSPARICLWSTLPAAQRGAAFIELAISIPILLLLCSTIFGVGSSLHEQITLNRVARYVTTAAIKWDRLCVNENDGMPSVEGSFREFMHASGVDPQAFDIVVSPRTIVLEDGATYEHPLLEIDVSRRRGNTSWLGLPALLTPAVSIQFVNNRNLMIERSC